MCPRPLCLAQAYFLHLMCALPNPSPKPLNDMLGPKGGNQRWEVQPPGGNLPPHSGPPYQRMFKEATDHWCKGTHFLWPGDRLSHTAPLLAAVISESSVCHIRKRQLGPHNPSLTFLCLLEAEKIHRVQITHVPLSRKSGFNPEALRSHG